MKYLLSALIATSVIATPVLIVSIAFARGHSHSSHSHHSSSGDHFVHTHFTKSGTLVAGHYQTNPDHSFNNNYSTKGNINPYTGAKGTRLSPGPGPADDGNPITLVPGYTRSDGTSVQPYYRSTPPSTATAPSSGAIPVSSYSPTSSFGTRIGAANSQEVTSSESTSLATPSLSYPWGIEYDGRPLLAAIYSNNVEALQSELSNGVDAGMVNSQNISALDLASTIGDNICVEALLDHGANVNARDNDGWTALMSAAAEGHDDVVQTLISKGAHMTARDDYGSTALSAAQTWSHPETAQLLTKLGETQ